MQAANIETLKKAAVEASHEIVAGRRDSSKTRSPDKWDLHAAERLKMGRLLRRLSQASLASAAGVSPQQLQKYEKGANRMSPARLVAFADALNVAPAWFFENSTDFIGESVEPGHMLSAPSAADLAVARDVAALPPPVKAKFVGLLRVMVDEATTPRSEPAA